MTIIINNHSNLNPIPKDQSNTYPLPFWVLWAIEFWERFGFYGVQAILSLYMSNHLGYTNSESIIIFGSFSAFCYGFVWVGGLIGDQYLGAKRTIILGSIILTLSYLFLSISTKSTFFYALSGIIVGNALFKANPSSLISKLYKPGDQRLDGAMTLYYFAINVGGFISVLLTAALPFTDAFLLCGSGLFIGLVTFISLINKMEHIGTKGDQAPFSLFKTVTVVLTSIVLIYIVAHLLNHSNIVTSITFIVSGVCFLYFVRKAFSFKSTERNRMIVALVLIIQGIIFFALYQQMPTSLTFFAEHNVIRHITSFTIPPSYFYDLNPFFIMLMSPLLAYIYKKSPSTHPTKFCFGMTLCALGFIILWLSKYSAADGMVSSWYLVLSYWFQATGELLISALGLAMVASLCPKKMSGFVMGLWFISSMLAGPIGAWVGNLTQTPNQATLSTVESLHVYTHAFGEIGFITLAIALVMWGLRPVLNRYIA